MQASTNRHQNKTVNSSQFSSYISSNNSSSENSWNNYLDSSDSSGSWTHGEGLPPPPTECDQLQEALVREPVIQANSVPNKPAKAWDREQSDEDLSDDGADGRRITAALLANHVADNDSISDSLDTESECTTEIFVPRAPATASTGVTVATGAVRSAVHQRRSVPFGYATRGNLQQRGNEVIPSVSSDNIKLTSPLTTGLNPALMSEDACTNIDSGISNETSHVHSQQSAVVTARAMSISSSSHYSSSYSCGSRGEIPSPKLRHQHRLDDITVYMREAKVSRVVSFLSAVYAVILLLLGVILPLFEVKDGKDTRSYVFEGYYIYLYGLGILFLLYIYANLIKDNRRRCKARNYQSSNHMSVGGGGQSITRENAVNQCDGIPCIGSMFLRIAVVLFCAGSIVDCGLRLGVHMGDNCSLHFLSRAQPIAQSLVMLFQLYFIFNNTKMNVRKYPITAKFGIMHLIATNISIWLVNTITESDSHKRRTSLKYDSQHYQVSPSGGQNYSLPRGITPTALQDNLLTVLKHNREPEGCSHHNAMVGLSEKANPYTYPCTVQFCLLATCILYVMWRNVDIDSDTQCSDCKEHTMRANLTSTRTIDCSHTSRGLFLGVVVVVAAVACLIVFFFFTSENYYDPEATLIIHIYQIALYLTMTIITVVVLLKLRTLDHNACRSSVLEDMLIMVCAVAILTHDLVGIISGILYLNKMKGLLVLATSSAELIQSLVQMAAIIMSLKLCTPDSTSTTDTHLSTTCTNLAKPGRECVTFLAVANIALWVISLFTAVLSQGFDAQLLAMGQISWGFIGVAISPFVMFYHLFSASCFIDIWYNAYKTPSAPVVQV